MSASASIENSHDKLSVDFLPLVSIIIPLHNASSTIEQLLDSIVCQDYAGPMEVSIFDDHSSDDSLQKIAEWIVNRKDDISRKRISFRVRFVQEFGSKGPLGSGFGRNKAVMNTTGEFLCLLDADDACLPNRISTQLAHLQKIEAVCTISESQLMRARKIGLQLEHPLIIVGGGFVRDPPESTASYTLWANAINEEELHLQSWRECTIIQPTWFMRKSTFLMVGGYDEYIPPALVTSNAPSTVQLPDNSPQNVLYSPKLDISLPKKDFQESSRRLPDISNLMSAIESIALQKTDMSMPWITLSSSVQQDKVELAQFSGGNPFWPRNESRVRNPPLLTEPVKLIQEQVTTATMSHFPEDLIFMHRFLALKGRLAKVQAPVLVYRYTSDSASWNIPRQLLLLTKVRLFEERLLSPVLCICNTNSDHAMPRCCCVCFQKSQLQIYNVPSSSPSSLPSSGDHLLSQENGASCIRGEDKCSACGRWMKFSIWGAGRDGKAFFNALSVAGKSQVDAFLDIDDSKIGQKYPPPPRSERTSKQHTKKEKESSGKRRPWSPEEIEAAKRRKLEQKASSTGDKTAGESSKESVKSENTEDPLPVDSTDHDNKSSRKEDLITLPTMRREEGNVTNIESNSQQCVGTKEDVSTDGDVLSIVNLSKLPKSILPAMTDTSAAAPIVVCVSLIKAGTRKGPISEGIRDNMEPHVIARDIPLANIADPTCSELRCNIKKASDARTSHGSCALREGENLIFFV